MLIFADVAGVGHLYLVTWFWLNHLYLVVVWFIWHCQHPLCLEKQGGMVFLGGLSAPLSHTPGSTYLSVAASPLPCG